MKRIHIYGFRAGISAFPVEGSRPPSFVNSLRNMQLVC